MKNKSNLEPTSINLCRLTLTFELKKEKQNPKLNNLNPLTFVIEADGILV